MTQFDVGGATISVWHDGSEVDLDFGDYRQRYGYRIVANGWEYVGNDIRSGCGARVDVADAARTLFSFLSACAESRQYVTRSGGHGENADLFPDHVGTWSESVSDELSMLSMEES